MASPASSVVLGRTRARNGDCSRLEEPRRLSVTRRPGMSGARTTWRSRDQAPWSEMSSQSPSRRSSEALMRVVMRTGVGPSLRTVTLRAIAAWSRKMVSRTVAVRPLGGVQQVDLQRVGLGDILGVRGRQPVDARACRAAADAPRIAGRAPASHQRGGRPAPGAGSRRCRASAARTGWAHRPGWRSPMKGPRARCR